MPYISTPRMNATACISYRPNQQSRTEEDQQAEGRREKTAKGPPPPPSPLAVFDLGDGFRGL